MVSSMSRLLSMAAELAEVWTRFYTLGMPQTAQQRRRQEIASDVWECLAEVSTGERGSRDAAVEILARVFLGIPDDILWRLDYRMSTTSTRGHVPLWVNASGLGFPLTALALYSAGSFSRFLNDSSVAIAIRDSIWIFPALLTLHGIAICAFIGFAALVDLRILGWTLRRTPVLEIGQSLLPWAMGGFAMVVLSGALVYLAEPARFAANSFFQVKVLMLFIGGLNAWGCYRRVYQRATEWDQAGQVPRSARIACGFSLAFWAMLIVAGQLTPFSS